MSCKAWVNRVARPTAQVAHRHAGEAARRAMMVSSFLSSVISIVIAVMGPAVFSVPDSSDDGPAPIVRARFHD